MNYAAATKLGLPIPNLSAEQRGLKVLTVCIALKQLSNLSQKSKLVATAGAAIGVVIGCCLGMMSLLFMDLEAAEHAKVSCFWVIELRRFSHGVCRE